MTEAAASAVRAPHKLSVEGPGRGWRVLVWLHRNLFSSIGNTVLTLAVVAAVLLVVPPFFRWAVTNATLWGVTKSACVGDGACWAFVRMRLPIFIFGLFPRASGGASCWLSCCLSALRSRCCANARGTAGSISWRCSRCFRCWPGCCWSAASRACPSWIPICGAG